MRIAFVVNQFPAVSETFILRQITGLLDRGHEVDIFAIGRTDFMIHGDVEKYKLLERTCYFDTYAASPSRLVRLAKRVGLLITHFHRYPRAVWASLNVFKFGKSAILLQVFNQIVPFLDKGPYDVIHCHFGPNGALGVILKDIGLFGEKLVTTFYGYDTSSYLMSSGDRIYDHLFDRGDLFLCVSEQMKEKLIRLGCNDQKVKVLRLGIDTQTLHVPPRVKMDGSVKILTVARLVEKKGVAYGIRAVAKVLQQYPHLEYKIVGDGPLKDKLLGLTKKLGVTQKIKLIGWKRQDEVANLLKESDILLAPSVTSNDGDQEGTPVAIIEAMAHGLPVVCTDHAGIPEVVKDGESGFLVPERDADGLAEKLRYLAEQPALRSAMGKKGRKFVEDHCNIDALNDRLAKLYQRLLGGGGLSLIAFFGAF